MLSQCPECKAKPRQNLGEGETKQFQKQVLGAPDDHYFLNLVQKRLTQNRIALALGIVLGLLVLLPSMVYAAKCLKDREARMELARQEEYEFERGLKEVNYSISSKTKISSDLLKKPASFWLRVLKQADKEQEVFSKFMLAKMGVGSRQEILSLLDSNQTKFVLYGLEIIQWMLDDSAREFLNEVIKFARDEDPAVKLAAVLALQGMKLKDKRLLPVLFELGSNGTEDYKKALNAVLGNLGPFEATEIQPFLKHLGPNADPIYKLQALVIFNQSNIDPSNYQDDLSVGLKTSDLAIKRASATALAKILKIKPLQVLPVLLPALADPDQETFAIIRGGINLVQLNSTSNLDFLPALLTEKNDTRTRQQCLELIAKIPYFKWDRYVPLIKSALATKEIKLQRAALLAVNSAGKEAVDLSPVLKEVYRDAFNENKVLCLKALGKMGRDGDALDEVIGGFVDPDKAISTLAQEILDSLDPKIGVKEVPFIKKHILFGAKDKRLYLLKALKDVGAEASKVEPELISLLGNKDSDIRIATLEVAGLNKSASKDLLLEVIKCLQDLNGAGSEVTKSAIKALEMIGPGTVPVQEELSELLDDKNPVIAQGVFRVLGSQGNDILPILPKLINSFKNRDSLEAGSDQISKLGVVAVKPLMAGLDSKAPEIRLGCAVTLGKIGPPAKEAAPTLARVAISDRVPLIRDAAKNSQFKVQAQPK